MIESGPLSIDFSLSPFTYSEKEEPERMYVRSEMLDPSRRKSHTLTPLPKRAMDLSETHDPSVM
jgi:hypothetical protein